MDSANSFNVEITDHSSTSKFIRGGGTKEVTRVSFFVGKYGPFTLEFDKGQDGADAIQAAINKQVQTIRQLNTTVY